VNVRASSALGREAELAAGVSLFRGVAELFTRRLVFRRRMPAEFGAGSIYVSPAAGLKFLCKPLEHADPPLLALARDYVHAGDVVWDVGANVGLFTFAAASRAGPSGKVFALEADDWLIGLLRKSARLSAPGRAPVVPIGVAVAEECGLREFQLATRSRASNALAGYGHSQTGGFREKRMVVAVSLDWLLEFLPPPAFVKIDVEGAEPEVLQGASRLIDRCRPRIACEVPGQVRERIAEFFFARDYYLIDGDLPLERRTPLSLPVWNTVALPR
jgi:FkbM family methyltransferase